MTPIVLENDSLRAEFSSITGALTALVNKRTGWVINRRGELGLSFRMLAPLPQRHLNWVLGERQKLASCRLADDGRSVTFVWERLTSEHAGELDVTFTGTVRMDEFGLRFEGTVANRSDLVIDGVAWPAIGDLAAPSPDQTLERLSLVYNHTMRGQLWPKFQGDSGYFGVDYPTNKAASNRLSPFLLVQAEGQGLYFGCHDPQMQEFVSWFFEQRPGYRDSFRSLAPQGESIGGHVSHLEMLAVHMPFVAPGQTWTLAPMVLAPYTGTWHRGADIYKAWRQSWFRRPAVPAWADDVHSWHQFQINSSEDSLRCSYKEIVDLARDCAKHGVSAIQLVGWNRGGQDRENPTHDTDDRLGTWQDLRDAIEESHKLGVKIILFSKFTWFDQASEAYRNGGFRHTVKDPYGDPYIGARYHYHTWTQLCDINTRILLPTCMLSAEWRKVACEEFRKTVALGAAGILYDESQHHGVAKCCFDESHGHRRGAFVYRGDNQLLREFKQISASKPDFLYAGEGCYDEELLEYHLSYFRIGDHCAGHMHRYVDPFVPLMVAVTGFDDRNQLNKCLQYRYVVSYEPFNFKGRLGDFPATMEYGKKIDSLRRQYRAFLWDGDFRDTCEAQVTAGGKPCRDYSVFRAADGRRAAVIANVDAKTAIETQVAFDGPTGRELLVADPETPLARRCDGRVVVAPESVAVVMER